MIALICAGVLIALIAIHIYAAAMEGNSKAIWYSYLAVSVLVVGVVAYPYAEQQQAKIKANTEVFNTASEANRAKTMIAELGSAENYLRYLETQE